MKDKTMIKTSIITCAACFMFHFLVGSNFALTSFACLIGVNLLALIIDFLIDRKFQISLTKILYNVVGSITGITFFQTFIIIKFAIS